MLTLFEGYVTGRHRRCFDDLMAESGITDGAQYKQTSASCIHGAMFHWKQKCKFLPFLTELHQLHVSRGLQWSRRQEQLEPNTSGSARSSKPCGERFYDNTSMLVN